MSARVLAVEDTPPLRDLLQLTLVRAGYRVTLAEDGGSAVELFEAGEHDAVVMDIQMPVMDGLTAAARMRECEKTRGTGPVPILALTANTEPGDLRKCLEAGFTATLRKPFAREDLLAALTRVLVAAPADGAIQVTADPEFAKLIPHFLDNCRSEAAAMRAALTAKDFPAITTAAHKLTGAGATYGFEVVSVEGRAIETAAKKSDETTARAHLDALSLYLDRVKVVYPSK